MRLAMFVIKKFFHARVMYVGLLWLVSIACRVAEETKADVPAGDALMKEAAVGIDLGTTFSSVGITTRDSNEKVVFITSPGGDEVFPSVVYFRKGPEGGPKYEALAGWPAEQLYNSEGNASMHFSAFKRGMGLAALADIDSKVADIQRNSPSPIYVEDIGGKKKVAYKIQEPGESTYASVTPEELSTHVLAMLKEYVAKNYKIAGLTVTVPAYFDSNQIAATVAAAESAGLPTPSIFAEPAAAAFAHTYDLMREGVVNEKEVKDMNICVFDLGGGTFDVSIVEAAAGFMLVSSYAGNNFLGGENVNDNLTNHFADFIKKNTGFDVMGVQNVKLRLRCLVEEMKKELCNKVRESADRKGSHSVNKPFFYTGDKSITLSLTNDEFNSLNEGFYKKIREAMSLLLEGDGTEAHPGYDKSSVDRVLLVGGSTRIPRVIEIVEEIFGASKIHSEGINADTIVARGASLYTANTLKFLREAEQIQVVDSVPLSLGIRTDANNFEPIILKGALVPASGTKEFTTAQDNQTKVKISVGQGERAEFSANHHIGDFELSLAGNQPRGVPRIAITVTIGSDGTLEVEAEDVQTKKKERVVFEPKVARITPEQVKKMEEDARLNAEADKEFREKYNLVKKFESAMDIAVSQETLGLVGADVKKDIEEYVQKTRLWLERNKELPRMDIEQRMQQFDEEIKGFLSSAKPEAKEKGREEL